MEPFVSVVVPVYNVEKYLKRAVDSVLNQTYKNMEIILVDDGSTDRAGILCEEYKEQDKRIQVIHRKNGGLSAARNTGIEAAKGDYITFLDSDDALHPQFIEIMLKTAISKNVDVVQCDFYTLDENEEPDTRSYQKTNITVKIRSGAAACQALYDPTMEHGYVQAWAKLSKIERFRTLRYPEGKLFEDNYVTYRQFYESGKVAIVCEKLLFHYIYSGSIMGENWLGNRDDIIGAFPVQMRYYEKKSNRLYYFALIAYLQNIRAYLRDLMGVNEDGRYDEKIRFYRNELKRKMLLALKLRKGFPFDLIAASKGIPTQIRVKTHLIVQSKKAEIKKYAASHSKSCDLFMRSNDNDVFIMNTPEHGNLGDHLITAATREFIAGILGNVRIHDIPRSAILSDIYQVKKGISDSSLIIINGGGNFGSLWPDNESAMRLVIENFPENRIIIFPQTLSYAVDRYAGYNKRIDYSLIVNHKNITVAFREYRSYHRFHKEIAENFPNTCVDTICVPDIALYYKFLHTRVERKGIALCLRGDLESGLRKDDIERIQSVADGTGLKIFYTTTMYDGIVSEDNRREKCNTKLREFSAYQLVITDRLHGMIYSVLAGTPCIVLDNSTHKVSGVYEWIKKFDFVKLVHPDDMKEGIVMKMLQKESGEFSKDLLDEYYGILAEKLRKC